MKSDKVGLWRCKRKDLQLSPQTKFWTALSCQVAAGCPRKAVQWVREVDGAVCGTFVAGRAREQQAAEQLIWAWRRSPCPGRLREASHFLRRQRELNDWIKLPLVGVVAVFMWRYGYRRAGRPTLLHATCEWVNVEVRSGRGKTVNASYLLYISTQMEGKGVAGITLFPSLLLSISL